MRFQTGEDGIPFAPINEDGIPFTPIESAPASMADQPIAATPAVPPEMRSKAPAPFDPAQAPMETGQTTDAITAFRNMFSGIYKPFARTMGVVGIPFEKAENVAATVIDPLAKVQGALTRDYLDRAAAQTAKLGALFGGPDVSMQTETTLPQTVRQAAAELPGSLKELGKALIFQENKAKTMGDVVGDYARAVTGEEASPLYKGVTGTAAGFLVDPFLVSAGLKGATAIGRAAGLPAKMEALSPTVWKLAKMEQRAGKAQRIDQAVELGKSTTGREIKAISEELSERAGTPIGPRAVEQRISQAMAGGITREERISAISNPLIREFEANADELQKLGILGRDVYTRKLTRVERAGLNREKAQAQASLRRLQTAPHYVGTPEISAKFPGRAREIEKLQGKIAGINERLYTSEVYGGTGYYPRMYRTKEEAAAAKQKMPFFQGSRIRAPYAKQRENIPADVRMQMGEMKEPAYPVTKRLIQQAADIENGRLFRSAAQNPQLASKTFTERFYKDPLPDEKAYGALAGMYVHPRVYHDVKDLVRMRGNVERMYDSFIGVFKTFKVPWSPSTHMRNMGTNLILNAFGGFGEVDQIRRMPGTIRQMQKGSEEWQYAKRYFRGSNLVTGEVLDDLLRVREAGTKTAAQRGIAGANEALSWLAGSSSSLLGKVTGGSAKVYQAEEAVNKFNRYLWRRGQGWSRERSIVDANKWGIDYSDLSALEKNVARRVMPFYTFPRKVIPLLVEAARDNPYAVAKYPMMASLMTKYSLAKLQLTDKDFDQIAKIAPDAMKDGGFILMPYRDANGDLRLFDWTFNVPWGPLADLQSRGPLETVVSNPIVQIAGDIMRNKSSWTDRPIFNEKTDPWRVKGAKAVLYAWQSLAPPLMPDVIPGEQYSTGGGYWGKLYDALTGTPKMMGPRLKQQPIPETIGQTLLGLRTQPMDVKMSQYWKIRDVLEGSKEISAEMRKTNRWYREGRITKAERDANIQALQERRREYFKKEVPKAGKGSR